MFMIHFRSVSTFFLFTLYSEDVYGMLRNPIDGTLVASQCKVFTDTLGECRRQVKNLTNCVKLIKIVKFHDHIWNHHNKYIEISTNMPVIGSLIRKITVKISEI